MKAILKTVAVRSVLATEANTLCQWMTDWLTAPDLATLDQVDDQFDKLITVINAIPPTVADRGVMGYLGIIMLRRYGSISYLLPLAIT